MELGNIADTIADRIQNAILTMINCKITPKIELAVKSINASSRQDATSSMASSERGEHMGITTLFENQPERNNTLRVLNTNDETSEKIRAEVSETWVSEKHFDRQSHTHNKVTGQRARTNQIPEILTGRMLTPREQQSHLQ